MHGSLALWNGDVLGLGMLIFALLGVACVQIGIAMAVMFAMNKLVPDKLAETTYGDFDFDSFQKPAFNTFLTRLAVAFGGPTLVLNLLEYLIVYKYINIHWGLVFFVMLILETAAIGTALFLIFRLDRFRLVVLTVASGLLYMLLFGFLSWSGLLWK